MKVPPEEHEMVRVLDALIEGAKRIHVTDAHTDLDQVVGALKYQVMHYYDFHSLFVFLLLAIPSEQKNKYLFNTQTNKTMSGLSVFRLVGNVSVNGGYGVAEVAEFGLPAHMIKTGRFTNDRLPLDPQIAGNLTPSSANSVYSLGNAAYQWRDLHIGGEVTGNLVPSANVTYDLGSADKRWKDLYLSGNTLYLGNTVISTATTTTAGNLTTTDLIIDGSRTIQTVGRTLADSYSASYSTNTARPDLVQTSVAANAANVVVSAWTTQRSAADNNWNSVVWAPELGLFVALARTGSGNRVMTSPDGVMWTARTSAANAEWLNVTWSPELGLFCAIGDLNEANVMTSPDGIRWTLRSIPGNNGRWWGITWAAELGIFCVVGNRSATGAAGSRVMTSPDGINWTVRTSASDNGWVSIVWAPELSLFVATATAGDENRVMTSPDGINWTARTGASSNNWGRVIWTPELGIFVAIAFTGTGDRVMTSSDGINWTARDTTGKDNFWVGITWAPELGIFVAVAQSGTGNRVMTSPDGINWTSRTSAADNQWLSVVWSPELGIFAAVAASGTGNRVMTSASALSTRIVGATSFVGSSVTIDGNDLLTTRDVRVTYPSEAPHGVKAGSYNYTGKKPALFRATTLSAVEAVSTWRAQASAADNLWNGVCWAPELGIFVAVAWSGSGNRVMTSPDGIIWTTRTSAADNNWYGLCWAAEAPNGSGGTGLFVAVAFSGTGNRVMTSPDGITWTARTSAADNLWYSVVWAAELSLFVAVGEGPGTGDRVMTSPDGITWTTRTSAADNNWISVVWAPELGIFVAVAYSGTGNRVMTSPDGVNWTSRTSAADNSWTGVCWAPEIGLFVAVANSGTGNRVMTSPDGITWTARTSAADNNWGRVIWTPELGIFVAVAYTGTGDRVMTSPDGITWTTRTSAANNQWWSVCWSPELGIFVAVAQSGTGNRVMTSRSALQMEAAGEATFKNAVVVPKLGVGTANPAPAYTLDVSGSMRASGNMFLGSVNVSDSSTYGLYWHTNTDYAIHRISGAWTPPNYQQLRIGWATGIVLDPGNGLYGKSYVDVVGYVNRILPSAINYGSYGSIGVAGSTNGWAGISFSDYARTFMVNAANAQGIFANNNTWVWRFEVSSGSFIIGSDSRIKKNIQDIDDGEALQKIRAIEPKTYEYVDTKSRGNVRVYGFIAQQIESVLPHAVVTMKNHAIPDIYAWGTKSEDGTISMDSVPVTFDVGETVCMYTTEDDEEKETWYNQKCTWVSDDKTSFRVDETENATIPTGPVFVSGRQVDDFKMLNKTAIFTVAVAALQEADREIQRLKAQVATMNDRFASMESLLATVNDRLAALESQ